MAQYELSLLPLLMEYTNRIDFFERHFVEYWDMIILLNLANNAMIDIFLL